MVTTNMDRRDFFKLTGAGALSVGAASLVAPVQVAYADEWRQAEAAGISTDVKKWSFMVPPEPISDDQVGETIDCDIVVVGCGVSAGPATMYAADMGANVHILEKGTDYGNKRFGTCCFNSKFQEAAGIKFERDRFMADGYRVSGGYNARLDYWGMFFDYSGPLMDYVNSRLALANITIVPATTSRDYEIIDGVTWNRGTADDQFWNGDEGFCQFAHIDPLKGGMAYPDWLRAMYDHAKEAGAQFHFNMPAKQLITDAAGNVTGVYAFDAYREKYVRFNTSKGVLLASGGMEGDKEMVDRYCPVLLQKTVDWSMIELKNTGDGQKMAMWAGADIDDLVTNGYWPFCTEKDASKMRPAGWLSGHQLFWSPSLASMPGLQTNIAGIRFQNEALPFTFCCQGMLSQPEGKTWSFWDGAWEQKLAPLTTQVPQGASSYLFSLRTQETIDKEVELGITVKADTIEELAQMCDFDADTFKETLQRYNQLCADGYDADFLKEAKWMTTLDTPPYYAARTVTSTTGTIGGLKYDKRFRVVNKKGRPIEGLYCAGVVSGAFYGPTYPGNIVGCAMGHGQTFATLAIRDMLEVDFSAEYPA